MSRVLKISLVKCILIPKISGGLAEKPVPGGVLGPTFACLMGQQFLNIKRGKNFRHSSVFFALVGLKKESRRGNDSVP